MISELFRVICSPKRLHTLVFLHSLLGFTTVGESMSYRLVSCPGSSSSCIQTSSNVSLYQLYNNYCICLFANLLNNRFSIANECIIRISRPVNYAYCIYTTSPARSTAGTDFFRIACSVQWLFQNFRGTLETVPLYLWFHAWKQEEITTGPKK